MPIEPWWETNPATTPRQELGMVAPELLVQIDPEHHYITEPRSLLWPPSAYILDGGADCRDRLRPP